jgi:hypothetical protein
MSKHLLGDLGLNLGLLEGPLIIKKEFRHLIHKIPSFKFKLISTCFVSIVRAFGA